MRKIVGVLVLVYFLNNNLISQNVKVSIFNQYNLKTVVFRQLSGKFDFYSDGIKLFKIKKNNILYFTIANDSISVWDLDKFIGIYNNIEFRGKGHVNSFRIEPVYPSLPERSFYGNLIVKIRGNYLLTINDVDIESYVAGVVESESGPKANEEYYKSQAIICRTYALGHLNRHQNEGFNLCDGVHCQVYKNMSYQNYVISEATYFTAGLVLVDSSMNLITAAFHSNSGGQTVNSEDVWSSSTSYLKSVTDTFSLNQHNSKWEKSITMLEWLNYIESLKNISNKDFSLSDFEFNQDKRKKYFIIRGDSIALKDIRAAFKLRSSFFSIIPKENSIVFKGKGYGHGVGLSQEGAMNMARNGYDFKKIIHFYYSNVKLVRIKDLNLN